MRIVNKYIFKFAMVPLLASTLVHASSVYGDYDKRLATQNQLHISKPPIFRFNDVGISVADLDAQIKWYGSVLGFDKVVLNYTDLLPLFHTVQLMNSVGTVVELQHHANSTRRKADVITNPLDRAAYQGIFHFALKVDDLNATYDYLKESEVTLISPPYCVPLIGCSAFVADPESNIVELVHYTFDPCAPVGIARKFHKA